MLDRLAELTSFSAGEELARQVEPSSDSFEANRWQVETTEARSLLDSRTDVTIGGARDIRRKVDNAERGFVLQPEDLLDIQSTVIAARDLRRKLERLQDTFPTLSELGQLIEECPGIVSAVSGAIDERGEVLDNASPELADIRRKMSIVHGRIQDKLRAILSSKKNEYLQEPTITTRSGRYVVPLKANYKGRIKGIVHDQSNSGATLWIEPTNTVELNNEFRALHISEEEEIHRILSELSTLVATLGDSLKRVVERLAELDVIFARGRLSARIDGVRPEFVPWRIPDAPKSKKKGKSKSADPLLLADSHPGSNVWIRGARHPLLDEKTVVPTDLLVGEDTYIVLITGPNTGGKTVSLKTLGMMVLMAQSGMHLPAVEARLTLFNNVYADIGDEQSIEQNLSTFSAHLTNITRILKEVDERSLALLDELGSGTDPAEGAALAQAIVNYLKDKGATTFVATHFPELKVYASQTKGATNASLLFDVETLMPTFEMTIGVPGRSNAFAIARRLGLEESILEDALPLVGASSQKTDNLLEAIHEIQEEISSDQARIRLALRQTQETRDELRARLETIEQEREQVIEEAHRIAEAEIREVQKELRKVRKRLRDTQSLNQLKKLQKETEQIEDERSQRARPVTKKISPTKAARLANELQIGDIVLITSLGTKGKIVNLMGNEAEIAVGRLRMRAGLEELEFKGREEVSEDESLPARARPTESPGMELDIRGQRVAESVQALEQYLDSAFLANLPWVRIIHGKGTGRLREAVRNALKNNQHVTSWEEGRDGEGGSGVTVAKLTEN